MTAVHYPERVRLRNWPGGQHAGACVRSTNLSTTRARVTSGVCVRCLDITRRFVVTSTIIAAIGSSDGRHET